MRWFITLLLMAAVTAPVSAQTPEESFRRALRLERTQGDYAGAIALYESIARDTDDRRLGARALIQIARAQENLGRAEAAQTYRRVMADYAEIIDLAAEARAGYARTRTEVGAGIAEKEPLSRTVVDLGEDLSGWGASMSPSGRYIAGVSSEPLGVRIVEVETGQRRLIPIPHEERSWAEYVRFSPDEMEVALVVWHQIGDGSNRGEVIRIDISTGEIGSLVDLTAYYRGNRALDFWEGSGQVHDWSQDGRSLLVFSPWSDKTVDHEEFLRIPVDGGEPELLFVLEGNDKSLWEQSCFSANGRYVFTDVVEGDKYYVRRYDTETVESTRWRESSVSSWLWGCTWDSDHIIYASLETSLVELRAAKPGDADSASDRVVARLGEGAWSFSGSKSGDVAAWTGELGGKLLRVAGVDSGSQEQMSPNIEQVREFSWSPSGERLAYSNYRFSNTIYVWNAKNGEVKEIALRHRPSSLRWAFDDRISYGVRNQDVAPDSGALSHRFYVDPDGEASDSLTTKSLDHLGARSAELLSGDRWIAWSAEQECALVIQAGGRVLADLRCFADDDLVGAAFVPSPYSDQILMRSFRPDSTTAIGILSGDGTSYREIRRDPWGVAPHLTIRWLSPTEVSYGRRTGQRGPLEGFQILNIESGELEEIAENVFEQFNIDRIDVRPGGKAVAFYGKARPLGSTYPITIIHNVDGGK